MKNLFRYLFVTVKGICMGAADVIPGVSGGTIAFMTGIYEELVGSINSINATAVKLLFTGKFRQFWKHINGNFLLSLIAGILISILSLAKLMQYLLDYQPIQTWAFFFGLIVASSIFILKGIKSWKFNDFVMLVFGIVLGVVVCTLSPTETPDGLWFILLCGAIAICAMILPGISGSFIKLKSLYEKNTNHCNVAARGCIDSLCAASGDRQGDGPERGATDRSGSHGKRQPHADRNDHGQRRPVQSVCITGRSPSVFITRIPDRRSSRER